jgi:hypothetical protein
LAIEATEKSQRNKIALAFFPQMFLVILT